MYFFLWHFHFVKEPTWLFFRISCIFLGSELIEVNFISVQNALFGWKAIFPKSCIAFRLLSHLSGPKHSACGVLCV